jgi:hypothetical protein
MSLSATNLQRAGIAGLMISGLKEMLPKYVFLSVPNTDCAISFWYNFLGGGGS